MHLVISLRFILLVCVKSRALLPRTTNNQDHRHRASRAKPDNISLWKLQLEAVRRRKTLSSVRFV